MKKSLLFICSTFLTVGGLFSQAIPASDAGGVLTPGSNINNQSSPLIKGSINNKMACGAATIATDTTVCDSASATFTATGGDMIIWYDSLTGGTALDTSATFTTPMINTTTSYYAEANCLDTTMMGLPAHGSNFSGSTRGFWFVAPSDFIITGLRVPTDANSGDQSIEIVKFNTAPTEYPALTNDFNVLGLYQNVANTNIITTFIPVTMNDTIGIFGIRGGISSYANGPYTTSINGTALDITRLGFQDDLNTVAAYDVFTELTGNISRTEMYYSFLDPAPRTSATVTVTTCTSVGEVSFEKFISVYPNPNNGVVWVENSSNKNIEIKVYNVTGEFISSVTSNQSKEKIDFTNLSNGNYFIQIISNNESVVKKIVLNK
jgi:hypothetical protein